MGREKQIVFLPENSCFNLGNGILDSLYELCSDDIPDFSWQYRHATSTSADCTQCNEYAVFHLKVHSAHFAKYAVTRFECIEMHFLRNSDNFI